MDTLSSFLAPDVPTMPYIISVLRNLIIKNRALVVSSRKSMYLRTILKRDEELIKRIYREQQTIPCPGDYGWMDNFYLSVMQVNIDYVKVTKCPSTWPAHFTAVTTHSFLHKQGYAAVHLPDRSYPVQTLVTSCDLCYPLFQSIIVSPTIVEANQESSPRRSP
jgi:hypothetical protein